MLTEVRWDNETDEEISLTMLRVLFEIGVVNCLGIVLAPGPTEMFGAKFSDDDENTAEVKIALAMEAHATAVRGTLAELGLAHVCVSTDASATGLAEIYTERAPPGGLVLMVAGRLTTVACFISTQEKLFCLHTQCVVLLGGVSKDMPGAEGSRRGSFAQSFRSRAIPTPGFDEADFIQPDLTAQNLALDPSAATFVYRICQRLSVPLTIVTRHLANACRVPRELYNVIASSGSPIGVRLRDLLQKSICQLWRRVCCEAGDPERSQLPERCDRSWFIQTFCNGQAPDSWEGLDPQQLSDTHIWDAVSHFSVYTAQLIIAALPQTRDALFDIDWCPVRGTGHIVIGKSKDQPGLKTPKVGARLFESPTRKMWIGEGNMLHDEKHGETKTHISNSSMNAIAMQHFLCQMITKGIHMNHSLFTEDDPVTEQSGVPRASIECDGLVLDLSDEPFPPWMQAEKFEISQGYKMPTVSLTICLFRA